MDLLYPFMFALNPQKLCSDQIVPTESVVSMLKRLGDSLGKHDRPKSQMDTLFIELDFSIFNQRPT